MSGDPSQKGPPSSGPAGADDRERTRYEVDVAVTIDSDDWFYAGSATNLSHGGFFVATTIVQAIGTRFRFSLQLGDEPKPVRGTGEVRWIRAASAAEAHAGLGIQFVTVDGDGRDRVIKFLAKRNPTKPPPPPPR